MSLEILQDLYDSEINFEITAYWDSGYEFILGIKAYPETVKDANIFYDLTEGIRFLRDKAMIHYPDSDFAKKYRGVLNEQ